MSSATDPHVLHDGHHPTPFTADEIRDASPDGRTLTVTTAPAGAPPSTVRIRYTEGDAAGAVQVRTPLEEDGREGEATSTVVTWAALQGHASFPVATTTRDEVDLDHELGALHCLRYTATDGEDVDTFWFDLARPGMPVRVQSARSGSTVVVMTVVADEVLRT
ncbi:hypothetical protein [Oryzobacter telluris]|uniref:hypothetical protein n=1 Tax=Oryzobacter telluris TaxID=3149179 RepID=UPI00370D1BD7